MLDVASTGDPHMLPIHWAASDGKIKSLKCVFRVVLHLVRSLHDEYPFWDAFGRFFLDSRVNLNALDGNGCTPVVIATQYNQVNAVAFLVKVPSCPVHELLSFYALI
jgi:hypothetical protein